jgi:hypothetical protein
VIRDTLYKQKAHVWYTTRIEVLEQFLGSFVFNEEVCLKCQLVESHVIERLCFNRNATIRLRKMVA